MCALNRKKCRILQIFIAKKNVRRTNQFREDFCDTGLRNARLDFTLPDEGQILENIVYNKLFYNGYSVNGGVFDSIEKIKNGKAVRKTNEID